MEETDEILRTRPGNTGLLRSGITLQLFLSTLHWFCTAAARVLFSFILPTEHLFVIINIRTCV